jgi:signal transduction histidine kinase
LKAEAVLAKAMKGDKEISLSKDLNCHITKPIQGKLTLSNVKQLLPMIETIALSRKDLEIKKNVKELYAVNLDGKVSDQGQGIPDSEQAKGFDAFTKTSVRSTASDGSTGLGLNIAKK